VIKKVFRALLCLMVLSAFGVAGAQETTGAMLGTVKDSTGAVIPGAKVTVSTPTLVGTKTFTSDRSGGYHFENLPPGAYTITVEAQGFSTLKQQNVVIEVGHVPSIPLTLSVGSESTIVDVSTAAPQIDVTSTTTQTNITQDVVNFVPHGTSFQSVIQFAPAASNEPLMGNTTTNGSGGNSPGSMSNGGSVGYSIAGGSDSENSYLVEGQETANVIGGYSHTNTPFDFIHEVEVKSSGISAQYGGALGGVVNVIMEKGTSKFHGSLFAQWESNSLDANPHNPISQYDNNSAPTPVTTPGGTFYLDQAWQGYQQYKPHFSYFLPGFTVGGPLVPFSERWREKLFFFVGFNPELSRYEESLNYGPSSVASAGNASGRVPFSQNTNTYYTTARIDAQVSKKVRVFGSWLYQLQRQNGETLPLADSTQGYYNPVTTCFGAGTNCAGGASPQFSFGHNLGYTAPNMTVNTGADYAITPNIVSTTRFGYYFENYHDFGYNTTGNSYFFETAGFNPQVAGPNAGNPGPDAAVPIGFQNDAQDENYTTHNASKAIQLDENVAWFKNTKSGAHNFNFGYSLNRLSNNINQHYNNPFVAVYESATGYSPQTEDGANGFTSSTGLPQGCPAQSDVADCQGNNGYVDITDYGTNGKATSYNHSIYAQDSWTAGKGVTINAGIRAEKEFLPGEAAPGPNVPNHPINFGWKDKIAPRIGVAWDVMRNGKLKVFGDYGKFYDQMKLNLAISSFGGQYWSNCYYGIDGSYTAATPTFDSSNRYCQGANDEAPAHFGTGTGGAAPAGLTFIENVNYRGFPTTCSTCSATEEGVAPNLKPYQQHESVGGVDYQLSPTVAFEARYDRRRLDRVIEDSSIYNPTSGETFVIINPGYGEDATFSRFCNFLYSPGSTACDSSATGAYPPNQSIAAARSYDGVEFRVTKAPSHGWAGMLSYTYSHFRGNYTGLTSSDLSDGGGGRNAPNNSRAFDEPYFQYNAQGGSSSGLLPTDRPNKIKGYGYYEFKYLHGMTSNFGLFSYFYEGSPNTTYLSDVGDPAAYGFNVDVFNRGKWANITQNPNTGVVTVGNPYTYRNPWYVQNDFNFTQAYHFKESQAITVQATFTNLFNEHAVTAVNEQADSNSAYLNQAQETTIGGYAVGDGVPFYAAAMSPWNVQTALNNGGSGTASPQAINSGYGKPLFYQQKRTIRLQIHYTF
jgi:hypothetical protein